MLDQKTIESSVSDCLVKAGTSFRVDQLEAYREAISAEKNEQARWVLQQILENARIAEANRAPLCDDTGIPHVFIEIGEQVVLPCGWIGAIKRGVARGLKTMPGRPMAVKGNDIERVEQSLGLYEEPDKLLPAPLSIREIAGKDLKITVLMLGGGPEIRAKTLRVFHKRSIDVVLGEVTTWLASEVKSLGCTPCVAAVGIGRTHMEASALMLEAMKEGDLRVQSPLETKITERLNATEVGPLGLGGKRTALGTFLKVGPLRASGVRIVCARPCCCFEPRKATVTIAG
ncbi:MAG: fumarate hydratase [Acidobacteriaceae bacterium]